MGLVPTSPVTAEVGTSVIPDFVRIAKSPADLRFTGAGPGPAANALPAIARSAVATKYLLFIILKIVSACLFGTLSDNAHRGQGCEGALRMPRRRQLRTGLRGFQRASFQWQASEISPLAGGSHRMNLAKAGTEDAPDIVFEMGFQVPRGFGRIDDSWLMGIPSGTKVQSFREASTAQLKPRPFKAPPDSAELFAKLHKLLCSVRWRKAIYAGRNRRCGFLEWTWEREERGRLLLTQPVS